MSTTDALRHSQPTGQRQRQSAAATQPTKRSRGRVKTSELADSLPVAVARQMVADSRLTLAQVADRLYGRRTDTSAVERLLGLREQDNGPKARDGRRRTFKTHLTYEQACWVCLALDLWPVDYGI